MLIPPASVRPGLEYYCHIWNRSHSLPRFSKRRRLFGGGGWWIIFQSTTPVLQKKKRNIASLSLIYRYYYGYFLTSYLRYFHQLKPSQLGHVMFTMENNSHSFVGNNFHFDSFFPRTVTLLNYHPRDALLTTTDFCPK